MGLMSCVLMVLVTLVIGRAGCETGVVWGGIGGSTQQHFAFLLPPYTPAV